MKLVDGSLGYEETYQGKQLYIPVYCDHHKKWSFEIRVGGKCGLLITKRLIELSVAGEFPTEKELKVALTFFMVEYWDNVKQFFEE